MSGRAWLALLVLAAAAGWWYSPLSPRKAAGYERVEAASSTPAQTAASVESRDGHASAIACRLPSLVQPFDPPRQSPVPASLAPFQLKAATLTPLAGFSIDARVLSRREYRSDREAELSPVDLALGWGRMRDDTVLAELDITQSGRWYRYRYGGTPPIPPSEIDRSAANMHMIPGSREIAAALDEVEAGQRVRIDGWLVEAKAPDGWRWRSSMRRDDTGRGACELVYVCAVTRL